MEPKNREIAAATERANRQIAEIQEKARKEIAKKHEEANERIDESNKKAAIERKAFCIEEDRKEAQKAKLAAAQPAKK